MFRRALSILVSLLLVLLFALPCYARGPTISFGTAAGMQGDTITVPIRLSENPGINTFSFGFEYDRSKLTLLEVLPSSNIGGQFFYQKKVVWLSEKDIKYNGDILYLRFRIKDTALSGAYEVNILYSPGDISNIDEKDISFTTIPGVVLSGIDQNTMNRMMIIIKHMFILLDQIC